MMKKLKRRDAIRAAVAGGGLLALRAVNAQAGDMKVPALAGNWESKGQPCAIFQQGPIMLVVDAKGALGTARMTDTNKFVILTGTGWALGLEGTASGDLKTIDWSDNTSWTRVK